MKPTPTHLRHTFLLAMGISPALHGCGPTDEDGDGVVAEDDCNDQNPTVHPNAEEVCDTIDNNCDGIVDDDAVDRSSWFSDTDGDGFGDPAQSVLSCTAPEGSVADNTDCAPDEPAIHPKAKEMETDRVDNDCDGMVDEMDCEEAAAATSAKQVFSSKGKVPLTFCVARPSDGSACLSPTDIKAGHLVKQVVGPAAHSASHANSTFVKAYWFATDPICGPDAGHTESCCYVFRAQHGTKQVDLRKILSGTMPGEKPQIASQKESKPVHGRPLVVNGKPRVASTRLSGAWAPGDHWTPVGLSDNERTALAQHWQQAGLYEHASVASFARFTMDLMALGAPPELLVAAVRAQADEVSHAQACFSVASSFAGQPLGPGPVDRAKAMSDTVTPERILVETIADACINETLAAAEAAWLSQRTEVEVIAKLLEQISEDESRHAALGWQTVQWLLKLHPELREVAHRTFDRLDRSAVSTESGTNDDWMASWGCMPEVQGLDLRGRIWTQVIRPCAEAVLRS